MNMKNKILIVEDEPVLMAALVDKFSREGFVVITAKNGKQGLELAISDKPDIILLDIIMPVMDGLTMLSELRKREESNTVKVILLTNLSDPVKMNEFLALGVDSYLLKSDWKIADVVTKVRNKLAE